MAVSHSQETIQFNSVESSSGQFRFIYVPQQPAPQCTKSGTLYYRKKLQDILTIWWSLADRCSHQFVDKHLRTVLSAVVKLRNATHTGNRDILPWNQRLYHLKCASFSRFHLAKAINLQEPLTKQFNVMQNSQTMWVLRHIRNFHTIWYI